MHREHRESYETRTTYYDLLHLKILPFFKREAIIIVQQVSFVPSAVWYPILCSTILTEISLMHRAGQF